LRDGSSDTKEREAKGVEGLKERLGAKKLVVFRLSWGGRVEGVEWESETPESVNSSVM
jgi:hypothetical protein